MSDNAWFTVLVILIIFRGDVNLIARAVAERIKRGKK